MALSAARADEDVHDLPAVLQRICRAATASLGLAGASVHLLNRPNGGGVVASSDDAARAVAEAAFTTGEGPSLDAYSQARPVFAPYLLDQGQRIWPGVRQRRPRVRDRGLLLPPAARGRRPARGPGPVRREVQVPWVPTRSLSP